MMRRPGVSERRLMIEQDIAMLREDDQLLKDELSEFKAEIASLISDLNSDKRERKELLQISLSEVEDDIADEKYELRRADDKALKSAIKANITALSAPKLET